MISPRVNACYTVSHLLFLLLLFFFRFFGSRIRIWYYRRYQESTTGHQKFHISLNVAYWRCPLRILAALGRSESEHRVLGHAITVSIRVQYCVRQPPHIGPIPLAAYQEILSKDSSSDRLYEIEVQALVRGMKQTGPVHREHLFSSLEHSSPAFPSLNGTSCVAYRPSRIPHGPGARSLRKSRTDHRIGHQST
jgi:hypothetical protein